MVKFELSKKQIKAIRKTVREFKIDVKDEFSDEQVLRDLADEAYCKKVEDFGNGLIYYLTLLHGKENKEYIVETVGKVVLDELNKNLYSKDNATLK